MRLNLGAGKVLFPWSAAKEAAKHPLLNVPDTAYEADWINVDALALPGIDQTVDLFAYPWPWEDGSVAEIWASHIIEHIPHEPRHALDGDYDRWRKLKQLDGFYAFFAEAYRVLEPGGTITVVAPYGKSNGALMDPQHTRFILETTFHYLGNGGGNSPTYDYKLPFNFECTDLRLAYGEPYSQLVKQAGEAATAEERGKLLAQLETMRNTYWNVAYEIRATLKALK